MATCETEKMYNKAHTHTELLWAKGERSFELKQSLCRFLNTDADKEAWKVNQG